MNAEDQMDLLSIALKYLDEQKWAIHPLAPQGKKPVTDGWNKLSHELPSREQIISWWQENPEYNIGLVTGEASGVVVLDIDLHKNPNAAEELEALIDDGTHRRIVCPYVWTGGGGKHAYFAYPDGANIGCTSIGIEGIDTRGNGGNIVLPPSIHPNGKPYRWNAPLEDRDLPPLPDAIIAKLDKDRPAPKPANVDVTLNPTDLLSVMMERCAFCHQFTPNSGDISEELWYRWLTQMVCFDGGVELAYELSSGSEKFDDKVTQKKIAHAQEALAKGLAPYRCNEIIGCDGWTSIECDFCIAHPSRRDSSPAGLPHILHGLEQEKAQAGISLSDNIDIDDVETETIPDEVVEEMGDEAEQATAYVTEPSVEPESPPSVLKWQDCEFLKYCQDNAQTLSEQLWYAMLSNFSRFENEGRQLAHQLSQNYPDYSEAETDKRLNHAETASRPITCKTIAQKGFKCPLLKQCKAKSPAALLKMNTSGEDKKGPTAEEIALQFLASEYTSDGVLTLRYFQSGWWAWNGKCYKEIRRDDLDAKVSRFITERQQCDVTTNFVSSAIKTLTGQCLVGAETSIPSWLLKEQKVQDAGHTIIFQNGILDFDMFLSEPAIKLKPHTPTLFSPVALPYKFNPHAECPEWLSFLDCNLEGDKDRIAIVQEFVGYCFDWDTRLHKFLLLEGESRTGKSTFTDVITALLGEENVSHVPLEMFGQRFALATTLSKLANITSDIGKIDSIAEGALKQFVGGDRMNFELKYRDMIFAYPTARIIIATNHRPKFLDRSDAIFQRMLLIQWNKVIEPSDQDVNLRTRIKETELPGVLSWALKGLRRLRENEQFSHAKSATDALDDYRDENNPAREFLSLTYKTSEWDFVFSHQIYAHYVRWCKQSGYDALDEKEFSKEVMKQFPSAQRIRKYHKHGQQQRGYKGIAPQV